MRDTLTRGFRKPLYKEWVMYTSGITRVPTPYSYSSAVAAGDFVFLGLHRGWGETFPEQFERAVESLRTTLDGFGLTLEHVVQVHVWLKHIADLPEMEQRFHSHFSEGQFPARMTATTEFIDADCLLMIEGVAYRGA
jgi:2-iminobutanoate/2-iminopropanoate deaminase